MKYIVKRFDGSKLTGMFHCDCCKNRITYGFILNTGERIDRHCKDVLKALIGKSSLTEEKAFTIRVSRREVEFFGLKWIDTPFESVVLTKKERSRLDEQAMKDEKDLFG